ncbi:glycoside hydrolase family 1 protein [Sphingomonas tagetis]|uniref:glycoside hydrolase family 1 protein n=1 Tax=Sphingomonas tagetis TaxID=2949092 RepID=UPI003F5528A2
MKLDRRNFVSLGATLATAAVLPAGAQSRGKLAFPKGFIWGASTAGHQVEGNDTASDTWFMENIAPTVFKEPAGDAANSFELWETDLDLCKAMGLNAYRFSVEWSRVEPEKGRVSQAALDHYKRIVAGCHKRGLRPIVTYNHFTSPRWFAAAGGWLNPDAAAWFAAYCERVTRAFGDGIDHAVTFNEPNLPKLIGSLNLPPQIAEMDRKTLERAAELTRSERFVPTNVVLPQNLQPMEAAMLVGHARARQAIKAIRGNLPVGFSLAIFDDQAAGGGTAKRDAVRRHLYGAWLEAAKADDYIGVQNYERAIWGAQGRLPPPDGARRGHLGAEVYPASLAGAVRYAHGATGKPVLVTEHGVGTDDDATRQWMIPEALGHLHKAMADGVPVKGYCHWSLIDNFEWIFGYGPKFGLHSLDRKTFVRTPKPSARLYGAIARANAV